MTLSDRGGEANAVSLINAQLDALSGRFVSRRAILELIMLGLIAREHVLLIGPPGTGKSLVVQAIARSVEARYFEYLIGRFTEPSELFGGLDLNALKAGEIRPVTDGMLPEAEIAFLDEIFLGSTAILNSLLKILNERTYRRGRFSMKSPMLSCVAASNALPEDPQLAAFADRFLLTSFVDPVADDRLTDLMRAGWVLGADEQAVVPSLPAGVIGELHRSMLAIDLSPVLEAYAHIVRKVRLTGAVLSDRKIVKAQKLIAAAALLRGQAAAGLEDLWPVSFLVQSRDQQARVRDLLQAELQHSRNPVLTGSVAQAVHGPTVHAAELTEQAIALLEERPALTSDPLNEVWLVRVETLMARIDAAFDPKALPQSLRAVRTSMESLLETQSSGEPVGPVIGGGEQTAPAAAG